MRRLTLLALSLGAVVVACESKTPVGPSTVTIDQVTTTTTSVASTTTVPPGTTTVPPSTTVMPTSASRRFIGAGGNPALPNDMTLLFQLVGGAPIASALDAPVSGPMATYSVTGIYRTGSGSGGTITGTLDGTTQTGTIQARFQLEQPGCSAEREFTGLLTPTNVQWSGGRTLQDCKDSPLGFSTVTLLSTGGGDGGGGGGGVPPTTTIATTTAPACTYGLTPGSATVPLTGGSGSIQVVTQPGCGWSAQSFVDWVTVQPASGAAGPGSVQFTVTAASSQRQATLIIAGLSFVLTQSASATTTVATTTSILLLGDLVPIPRGNQEGSICNGDPSGIRFGVENRGQIAVAATNTRVTFIEPFDPAQPPVVVNQPTPPLQPGQELVFPIAEPPFCDGFCFYDVRIEVDSLQTVAEASEANNLYTMRCTNNTDTYGVGLRRRPGI